VWPKWYDRPIGLQNPTQEVVILCVGAGNHHGGFEFYFIFVLSKKP